MTGTSGEYLPCTDHETNTGHCIDVYGGVAQLHKEKEAVQSCRGDMKSGECSEWSPGVDRYGYAISNALFYAFGL